jgi:hypothetical protein
VKNNHYIEGLLKTLSDRYAVEGEGMGMRRWLEANTSHRGVPFSFRGYGFQRAIADDLHPEMDVMKISQVGLTEIQARKMLALLVRNPGRTGIFSLPNEAMYRRFSQSRLLPMAAEDRVFRPSEGDVRSMNLIQLRNSFLHVVNATEASATSTSADFVFNDEVDISDQKVLALFASRTQNSDMAIRQRFSTPTWTGFGIHATHAAGDQREYFIKCRACGHQQVPKVDRHSIDLPQVDPDIPIADIDDQTINDMDMDAVGVVCTQCRAPLDLDDDEMREWVATHPGRVHARSYHVRPFSAGRITVPYILRRLVEYRRRDYIRGWWNTVVGEPYTDSRSRLEESDIRACMLSAGGPPVPDNAPVFLGIDMGQVCHLTMAVPQGDGPTVVEFRAIRANDIVDEVKLISERFNLVAGACDRHPYTPTADEIFEITQGRVVPLEYRGDAEFKPVKQPDGTVKHWQANRTRLLDEVANLIRRKRFPMTGYGAQAGVLVEHLRDMIRQESPEQPATWVKLNGNDHYFHSLAFLLASWRMHDLRGTLEGLDTRSSLMIQPLGMPTHQGFARGGWRQRGILHY